MILLRMELGEMADKCISSETYTFIMSETCLLHIPTRLQRMLFINVINVIGYNAAHAQNTL